MVLEKVVKGQDWNGTFLQQKINLITDDNLEFKGDYEIEWNIVRKSQKGVQIR